ncbi:hypothetical protein V2A60_006835 [Cordyceps javanica]
MATSPYPNPPPSTLSGQTISPNTSYERDPKRLRVLSSHSSGVSGASADVGDLAEHGSIDGAHEHLDMNYSQHSDIVGQSNSAVGVSTSSTMPTDAYPVVGAPYWSGNSVSAEVTDKSDPEARDGHTRLAQIPNHTESQIYGNGTVWDNQGMSISMNPIQQYIPRRMVNNSWESDIAHHHQSQPQPHPQMQPDSSLASPYESSSGASNTAHMFSDYSVVNGPSHRIIPSNGYETSASGISTPTTPHHAPGPASGWPQTAFHGPGGSMGGGRIAAATGSVKDIKPKILASSASGLARKSPVQQQQRAATPTKSERAKSGDRTTHNDVERKYRTNLKDRIAELRAAIPALQAQHDAESDGTTSNAAPKVSKGTVLSKATEYIQQLEQANRLMMNEHQHLIDRLHALEAMLQNGGARPPQYTSNHGMNMFDPRGFS